MYKDKTVETVSPITPKIAMPDDFYEKNSIKKDISEENQIQNQWRDIKESDSKLNNVPKEILCPSSCNSVSYLEEEHKGLVCDYSTKFNNELSKRCC